MTNLMKRSYTGVVCHRDVFDVVDVVVGNKSYIRHEDFRLLLLLLLLLLLRHAQGTPPDF